MVRACWFWGAKHATHFWSNEQAILDAILHTVGSRQSRCRRQQNSGPTESDTHDGSKGIATRPIYVIVRRRFQWTRRRRRWIERYKGFGRKELNRSNEETEILHGRIKFGSNYRMICVLFKLRKEHSICCLITLNW